jgi:hypothetical protein
VINNLRFVLVDPEPANITYEIANTDELAHWAANVAGCDVDQAMVYVAELDADYVLGDRVRAATAGHWLWTKASPPFGRRAGWYALVRAIRPALIVETGVHDGLGSLVLLRALERNIEEGHPGRLVSFDINPRAGWLVGDHPLWELRIEDSRVGLPQLLEQASDLGMFIYDGWHTYADERADHMIAVEHLAARGVLLSDDAYSPALSDVCRELGLRYYEFRETPTRHFYSGTALGAGCAGS